VREHGACRRWSRRLPLVASAFLLLVFPGLARGAEPLSAAQRLANEYAPITMVRVEDDPPCDTTREQYQPTSVDTVLGNPTVTLEHAVRDRKGTRVVRRAPTAKDIAGLGSDYYLNLRGSPLGDTCVYARSFAALKRAGRAPVVTYAHIARERGYSGFALQFFFFWYFNQFNDLHESDWEGMQLTFDADSPREALGEEPDQMILFQHAGGERADWDDEKVQTDGRHPVVHPAAGSHATFYSSAVYVENGEHGSGLGCDNSAPRLRELRPRPILLPDRATRTGPFAWLRYTGHWGQKEAGFNTGPTGPSTKKEWTRPFSWMAEQRRSSARMPAGSVVGPEITQVFCGAVADVSELLNAKQRSSLGTILTLAVVIVLIAAFLGLTRWRPVDLKHLRTRRSFGQLIRTARQLYGRHWSPMVLIALTAIPIVGGAQYLARLPGTSTAWGLAVSDFLGTFARPIALAIVSAAVIEFVRSLVETGHAGFVDSWRRMSRRFWRVVATQLLATLAVSLMAVTIIGIPLAVWKLVGWSFVQQEVLFSDKPIRGAFRGSSDLVGGRWWHTARPVLFLTLITLVTGPMVTFALIFTPFPLFWINVIGSLIFALLIPYVALGYTLLYLDLQARAETEPAKPRRSWRPWRPRTFGRIVPTPKPAPGG
jgi:hypothetical protein